MPSPIDPTSAAVTCVYDSHGKEIVVTGPVGGRCTLSFDPATDGPGVLSVTPRQVAWNPVSVERAKTNAAVAAREGAWQTGDRHAPPLCNPTGARTTFMFDSERRAGQAAPATFVFEPRAAQPIVLIFLCASPELREICELFRELFATSDPGDVGAFARAIVDHPAVRDTLRSASARVLDESGQPASAGLIEQLADETAAVLLEGLALRRFKWRDEGPIRLGAWLSKVIGTNARHTWKRHGPQGLHGIGFATGGLLDNFREQADDEDARAELRELIALIPSTLVRDAMQDWADGFTVRESAEKRSLSKSTVHRLRAEGVAWILDTRNLDAGPAG